MTITIKVYSDYVCPFCFIAEKPLKEAAEGKDVEIEWMPYELRPAPQETLKPEGDYLQNTWKSSVYPLADQYDVKMVLPAVSPQPHTHLAFEGYQFAKEHGKAEEYNHRLFQAFFQEEQNIGDIDVLTRLAEEIGLDKNAYRQAVNNRIYKDVHQEALEHAMNEAGVNAVPTFIIGDTTISGVAGREQLEQAIDKEAAKQKPAISFGGGQGMVCGPDGCF